MAEYRTDHDFTFEYDPSQCLPPDKVSECMAFDAGFTLNVLRMINGSFTYLVNVLDLGVGSGVILLDIASFFTSGFFVDPRNINYYGIDNNRYCVDLTRDNLSRLAKSYDSEMNMDIFLADWFTEKTWTQLERRKYQAIIFNPPFLPSGESVRDGYGNVPENMIYTSDPYGIEHYQQVLPRIPELLSEEAASSILIRTPRALEEKSRQLMEIERMTQEMATQLTGTVHHIYKLDQICGTNRVGSWTIITRAANGGQSNVITQYIKENSFKQRYMPLLFPE